MSDPLERIKSDEQWAKILNTSVSTFRSWIKNYQIPYYRPGNMIYVDAGDFWKSVPRITHEDKS